MNRNRKPSLPKYLETVLSWLTPAAVLIAAITITCSSALAQDKDPESTSPLSADLVSTATPIQHPVRPLRDIAPANIGEFVAVEGTVAAFYPPPEPRAPYAILLKDPQGDTMRIVMWPDIYERIDHHTALQTTGTRVRATAEVAEYNEKIELHLADYEEMDVTPLPGDSPAAAPPPANADSTSSSTASATTATVNQTLTTTSSTSTPPTASAAP